MKEFPKMLYKTYSDHITVDTGKEETAARADGYMDYADLSDGGVLGGGEIGEKTGEPTGANVSVADQFEQLQKKHDLELQNLQAQIDQKVIELEQANSVNLDNQKYLDELTAELATKDARIKGLEDAKAQAAVDVTQANTDPTGANTGKAGATTKVNK